MRPSDRVDFYYWIAALAAAVALMGAASLLQDKHPYVAWGCVIGGAFVALLMLLLALRLASHEEKRRHRMIPLIGMLLCGVGFLGFAGWYFWPIQEAALAAEPDTARAALSKPPSASPQDAPFPYVEMILGGSLDIAKDDAHLLVLPKNATALTNVEVMVFRNGQGQSIRFFFPVIYERGEQLITPDGHGLRLGEGTHTIMLSDLNGSYYENVILKIKDEKMTKDLAVYRANKADDGKTSPLLFHEKS